MINNTIIINGEHLESSLPQYDLSLDDMTYYANNACIEQCDDCHEFFPILDYHNGKPFVMVTEDSHIRCLKHR